MLSVRRRGGVTADEAEILLSRGIGAIPAGMGIIERGLLSDWAHCLQILSSPSLDVLTLSSGLDAK